MLSFDFVALAAVRARNAGVRRVALIEGVRVPENITAVVPEGTTAVGLSARLVTERRVHAARRAGLDLYVFTVNDPAQMGRLIDWEVTGIITDTPDVLRRHLQVSET